MTYFALSGLVAALALIAPSPALPNGETTIAIHKIADEAPPEKMQTPEPAPVQGETGSGALPHGNLSGQLDKSNGVIRPKTFDPKIEKPAPVTGSMPVIKPPAGPGSPSGTEAK